MADLKTTKHRDRSPSTDGQGVPPDETDVDRLGRTRPEVFSNGITEVGFVTSVLVSNLLSEYLTSGFNLLLPALLNEIDIAPENRTWPTNIYTLVVGAFLLPFGRLADMYGGNIVFYSGLAWAMVWTLIGGFSNGFAMLLATRALQGLGIAAVLPSGIALLGNAYRPGPRKNMIFSLYGGCAPFGFFAGIFFAGLSAERLTWGWWFWIACILFAVIMVLSLACIPRRLDFRPDMKMDWIGCATIIPALFLLVYAITDSARVGWASAKILAPFLIGLALLGIFVYVEGWVAKDPLLPSSTFKTKGTAVLFLQLFIAYGSFGIYIFYASFYIETVLNIPPLLAAAYFAPLAAGGITIALAGRFVLHRLSGTILLFIASLGFIASLLLFALIPSHDPNYWAWIFPAMICTTIGVDISYNVSNIFITTSVSHNLQGVAGACVNGLVFLGMAFFLGWADLVVAYTSVENETPKYKYAFWLGVGAAGAAFVTAVLGVRVDTAQSGLTADEKTQLRKQQVDFESRGVLEGPRSETSSN